MLPKQNSGSPDEDKEPDSSSPLHDFSQVQRQAEETLRRFAYLISPTQIHLDEKHRHIEETFKRLTVPADPIRKAIIGYTEHYRNIEQVWTNNLSRLAVQQRQIEETFKLLQDPAGPIALTFRRYTKEENRARDFFSSVLARIPADSSLGTIAAASLKVNVILSDISNVPLEVTPDTQIPLAKNSLPIQDVAVRIDEFISNSQTLSQLTKGQHKLSDAIDSISDEIKKQNSPIQIILFQVLLAVLVGYFINLTTPSVDEAIHRQLKKKEIVKKLQTEANSLGLQGKDLQSLRVVMASSLRARETPSRRSKTIGILYQGQVVKQVTKGRDWTLVEFLDGDTTHRGWAFTRYLMRIELNSR
ncbi:MAG: SH3 domain-containing protein [Nitrospira sp.]|nr:MAG: SH3 domain-containing protein [Nitrospira sp.]